MSPESIVQRFRQSEPWSEPDLSVLREEHKPPPTLQLDAFGPWAGWIGALAECRSVPVDYVAAALLASASSLLCGSRRVSPWPEWVEPGQLWFALVGTPSSGKSPALDPLLALLALLTEELTTDFPDELRRYEAEKEAANLRRTEWEKSVKSAVEKRLPPPDLPPDAVEPEPPASPRLVVNDLTVEALYRLLSVNPRGVLLHRDELTGWLHSFDRYTGNDRPFWLEAYDGRAYRVDRVKNPKPLIIPAVSISVIGGIQPDRLKSLLLQGDDDGLASRLIMIWPLPVPPRRPRASIDNHHPLTALRRLRDLKLSGASDETLKPRVIPFEEEAAELLDDWRREHAASEHQTSGLHASHYGKLPGILVRLALVLEYLQWSWDGDLEPPAVSAKAVGSAADLIDEYLKPMARRCYGQASNTKVERYAADLARALMSKRSPKLNVRDISREWKISGLDKSQDVERALEHLTALGLVRPAPSREGDTPGRPRKDFEVNPALLGGANGPLD